MFVLFYRCRTARLISTRGRFRQAPMPSDHQGALGCAVAQISDSIFKQPTVLGPSLRANGSRERAPDDRLRKAIQTPALRMVRWHQTSDAQLRIGESRDSGFDASHRPGMTATTPRSRGAMRPSCARTVSPRNQRAQGMPGAQCTHSLACEIKQSTRAQSPQVHRSRPGLPCAMVLRLTSRSPRRPCFVVTVACAPSRRLDASIGASEPHDLAVRISIIRPARIRAPDAAASTASRSAFVTCARPSVGTGHPGYASDLGRTKTKIFLRKGLDRPFRKTRSDLPVGQKQLMRFNNFTRSSGKSA